MYIHRCLSKKRQFWDKKRLSKIYKAIFASHFDDATRQNNTSYIGLTKARTDGIVNVSFKFEICWIVAIISAKQRCIISHVEKWDNYNISYRSKFALAVNSPRIFAMVAQWLR